MSHPVQRGPRRPPACAPSAPGHHDVVGHGRFSLIVGVGGKPWERAAAEVSAALGVELPVYSIGLRCAYDDVAGEWEAIREVGDQGAILVRPDRHIAWRSLGLRDTPADELRAVLQRVLALGS